MAKITMLFLDDENIEYHTTVDNSSIFPMKQKSRNSKGEKLFAYLIILISFHMVIAQPYTGIGQIFAAVLFK